MARVKKEPIIITLDTETYNGLLGDLKRIAIYDGSKVHYGYSFADIEPILLNYALIYDVHIYIHNAEFDIRKIPELFDGSRVIWNKSLFINGKVTTLKCEKYTIHDSFKILPNSLKELSGKKGFNVEHGKLDLWDAVQGTYPNEYTDAVDFLDRCQIDDPLFLEYLGYDVISLYEVLQTLIDIAGLTVGEFVKCVSTASLSRYIFKTGYKGKPFKNDGNAKTDYEMLCSYKWDNDIETEEFIRMSYCGGRVEVFKPILGQQGYHYDVNSLYPYVMRDMPEYPIGKPQYTEKPALAKHFYESWKQNKIGLGFVNCHVFIPMQHIPPLPVKMGKLCFPCGEVYGTWTYEELEYAEKECGVVIKEFYCACHFEQTYPVFKNFIGTFYHLKEEATENGNIALRTLAKLLMNVGYGYTGMTRDKTTLDDFKNMSKYDHILFADAEMGFIEVPADVKAEYIQVQVASYVTSRARLVLLKALKDVERRGGEVYYCDTDSIVSSIPFDESIVHESHLGFWDCESKPMRGIFLKPKVYTETIEKDGKQNDNIKFKGVSRDTQKELDFDFYEHLLHELQDDQDDYVIVEKNKTLMRSILYMKKNDLESDYHETRDKKMNVHTVEKRVMNYNDNWTQPHYFETIEQFENFNFKPVKRKVEFDMTKGGHL